MTAKFQMQAGNCPKCNSTDLLYNATEQIDNIIRYFYICEECGFNGGEDYSLNFIGHVAYKDGIEILENPE